MADSQNPVYTDNTSVFGDGTEEHPLSISPDVADFAKAAGTTATGSGIPVTQGVESPLLTANKVLPVGTYFVLIWASYTATAGGADASIESRLRLGSDATGVLKQLAISDILTTKNGPCVVMATDTVTSDGSTPIEYVVTSEPTSADDITVSFVTISMAFFKTTGF